MADLQGNGAPQAPQGTGAPEAPSGATVSLDDVNRAITARLRDYEKKIDSRFGEFSTSLESKLTELLQPKAESEKAAASDKTGHSIEEHPIVKSQQKQLSELKNKIAEQERQREADLAKHRDLTMRQKVVEALASHGIEGSRAKHALAFLVDGEKRISVDPDETIVFRDANGDALDLQTGLKSWVATDDAKFYLPPRGAAGSGDTNRHGTNGSPRVNAPPDAAANLTKLIGERFFGSAG